MADDLRHRGDDAPFIKGDEEMDEADIGPESEPDLACPRECLGRGLPRPTTCALQVLTTVRKPQPPDWPTLP